MFFFMFSIHLLCLELYIKMSRKEALTQFIQQIHGRPVVVKLNSGVDYRGLCFFFLLRNV